MCPCGRLVAIVGPTGIGKSRLAFQIAHRIPGELIGADSRQIYRLLDIGTAKPTAGEIKQVSHHLIDIVSPDQSFSLAEFLDLAYKTIDGVLKKNRVPYLVGGSGQYVWAVIEGWNIPPVKPDSALRQELENRAAAGQGQQLHQELVSIDPTAASRIDPRNIRRVIRAIEIASQTGIQAAPQKQPRYQSLVIGLTAPREVIYRMTDGRVEDMIEKGLVQEVRNLIEKGYNKNLPSMSGIGYRQVIDYLEGKIQLGQAIERIKHESHRLVRMQYNWFSLQDDRIKWFDITQSGYESMIEDTIRGFLLKS